MLQPVIAESGSNLYEMAAPSLLAGSSKADCRKRRRAVSPNTVVPHARRLRLEMGIEQLELSPSQLQMVNTATEAGIDMTDPRPRVINRRHVVSHEYPIHDQVK